MTFGGTGQHPKSGFVELTPRQRRRTLIVTLTRAFVGAILLFVLYYTLPLDRTFDGKTILALVIGLIVVGAAVAVQVKSIMDSRYPRLRAIGALAITLPLFILIFAATYYLIAQQSSSSFNEPLTRTDSLYFTMTVFSTVGFGDIVPVSQVGRVVAMIQMVGDLALFGIIGKVVLGAVSVGLERSASARATPPAAAGGPAASGGPDPTGG